ncbi:hypothetical protein F0P96_06045 [Hymenobacter busanensis]|uniref:Uncharacterized protein n=1 Tax=Hymenobacter busanensis TaxID=2607656 RepID=A0A7L5A070_9BACT|nr:hypothetical protein [Hymenobacter busanensis]KAA9338394.1 hypothetical protein F0P96_06045 [Hymenobacter busanensis]QHJ09179.1 hypothetical protein GUY19_18560 [Hymenobacter busanensis]
MRLTVLLFAFSVLLLASTCRDDAAKSPEMKVLFRTWLHAHEEDQGDVLVYRPNTYSFKPSRGRTGFAFDPNGLFTQYDIAPTDGMEGRRGQWTAENDHTLRISLQDQHEPDYRLEIVSLTPELLQVRRLPVVSK